LLRVVQHFVILNTSQEKERNFSSIVIIFFIYFFQLKKSFLKKLEFYKKKYKGG